MRNPGNDGNLYVMNIKDVRYIKAWKITHQEHRSTFYMEIIGKHDKLISTYTWFCLDLSYIASELYFRGHKIAIT